MGFSLGMFFKELLEALNTAGMDDSDVLDSVYELVVTNRNYAKECGLINE